MNLKVMKIIFAIVILSIPMFVSACSKTKDNTNDIKEIVNTNSETKSNSIKENVTITFWHHYNEQSNENKVLNDIIIPKFEEEHPNIKVEPVSHDWADLHNKVLVAANANNLPDVIRADSAWVPEFVELGILLPLDKTFKDFESVYQNLLEGPMDTAKVNGSYYGLALNTNTKILFYNTKILSDNNVSVPKTLDEFFEVSKIVSDNVSGRQVWGYGEPGMSGWNVCPLIWSNGGEILSEDNSKAEGYLNSEVNIMLLEQLVQLFEEGGMTGFNSGDIPMTDGFAQSRYAMIFDGPWKFAELRGGHSDFTDYAVTTMPEGKGGSIQVLGGEDITITSNANKEYAWEFVKFMTDEFAQIEMGKVGQIPVNKLAIESDEIKNIDDFTIFLEAIKTARPRPAIAEWPRVDQEITDAFMNALLGVKTPKDALDDAAQAIDQILNE